MVAIMKKVKVTTPNPPCPNCGGMAGYHSKTCTTNAPPELDLITDVVLSYHPKPKSKAAKKRARKKKRDAKKG